MFRPQPSRPRKLAGPLLASAALFLATPAPADLVAAWTFDDPENLGENTVPGAADADHAQIFSNDQGKLEGAIFNSGGYLIVEAPDSPVLGRAFTVALWADWQGAGREYLLSKGPGVNHSPFQLGEPFQLYLSDGYLQLDLGESAETFAFDDSRLPADEWTHVLLSVATARNQTHVNLWINGQPLSFANSPLPAVDYTDALEPLMIAAADFGGSHGFPYEGGLDDVALWDEALSPGQAAAVHNAAAAFGYNAAQVQALFDVFDAPGSTAALGELQWRYATGLDGRPGEVLDDTAIVFDPTAGTGVRAVPQPATPTLLAMAILLAATIARRASRPPPVLRVTKRTGRAAGQSPPDSHQYFASGL